MKAQNDISLVVFDMAGTTVHDEGFVNKALQNALSASQVEVTSEAIDVVMGYPKPTAIGLLLKDKQHPLAEDDTFIQQVFMAFQQEMLDFYSNDPKVVAKKNAEKVFRTLRENGIKVALDTGFDRKIADTIIQRLGWQDLIDASVTSDEVSNGRPHADLILEVLKRVGGVKVAQTAKVGDTVSDVQEGRAAKCGLVVAVTTGANEKSVLEAENPDICIEDLSELLAFLGIDEK